MSAVRLLTLLLGLLLGWVLSRWLPPAASPSAQLTNILSLMLAGLLAAFLLSSLAERRWVGVAERLGRWYAAVSPRTVTAATFGLVIALLVSVLLSNLLGSVPVYRWWWNVVITLVLALFFVTFAVRNAEAFSGFGPPPRKKQGGKLIDSNIIIDGRIVDLARAGFLDGELIVPGFVLRELQLLADHGDPQRRSRGKRGLNVLEELRQVANLRVEDWDTPELTNVDDKLVRLARESGAKLMTNDSNLSKIAKLHGLTVLSLNEAAVALRPQLQPGDVLTVTVSKGGQQAGQGVAYLDDGTMIVVEDGQKLRGRPARVVVVNNVQTNVGRMIFAKPDKDGAKEGEAEQPA
ncbi:twitching motility protein PilT [Deinococcus irradiatisoli]|uniref:Twitching motility protein PilT n=1 Tax=Deinococcus irradiatisoli TaxID=2202254 RepID=A0A2Z3JM72_9DEIO|nr:twitching motility protein PilT [Deinococcus irradiatisoli]AWN23899.1 twitching motility protein PilT [Deinococcus irradiatisoli]